MLLVTNRPSVYVLIDGVTVELEVDKPTEVPDFQGKSLLKREICMVVVDAESTDEVVEEAVEAVEEPEPAKKPAKKK